ncbi:MAG: reverse transcriptase-like protein [Thaumarchaeota archaeon]|nr:reverse transcriptase-like protein [Nitrososphaerota archaeon]
MPLSIFVDGSGGPDSGFGFFVKETGESFYKKEPGITNNEAEYMAIIAALKKYQSSPEDITIYSDSKNTVSQLNHEFAINKNELRTLAMEAWELAVKYENLKIVWIPRKENMAGKMLGS